MSDSLIPFLNSLEGHIVLWAKGHYGNRTFDEVVTAYTAWPGKHGEREKCRIMMRALHESKQMPPYVMDALIESFFFHAAIDCKKLTSYHVTEDDKVRTDCLTKALFQALRDMQINEILTDGSDDREIKRPIVLLPDLIPDSAFERRA